MVKGPVVASCPVCGSRVPLDAVSCECGHKFFRSQPISIFERAVSFVILVGLIVGVWYLFFGLPFSSERLNDPGRRTLVLVGLGGFVATGFGVAALHNLIWPGPPRPRGAGSYSFDSEGNKFLAFDEVERIRAFYAAELPSIRREAFVSGSALLMVITAAYGAWLLALPIGTARSWLVIWPVASLWLVAGWLAFHVKYRADRPRFK